MSEEEGTSAGSPPTEQSVKAKRLRLSSYEAGDAIELSEKEREVFAFLLQVNDAFALGCTLRVAGGWVRDKLRGEPCYDIDIALDNMMGKAFAERVNEHLAAKGLETHHIGVIQANPEQSKHLETATMRVFDMWVDLVNLREESYSEHSRIPSKMRIGTPLDDANRRDLTINSLFYNINKGTIEDWTKRGLADLKAGIIRTPLPAETTFMDDPLRILRAIRFASRFEFQLDNDIIEAVKKPHVRCALSNKVSRERIGKELDGMLCGPHPELAFHLIHSLGLHDVVWALPPKAERPLVCNYREQAIVNVRQMKKIICHEMPSLDKSARRRLVLAAFLKVYAGIFYLEKNRPTPLTHYIIRDSLRWKAKDMEEIYLLHSGIEEFHALFNKAHGFSINRKEVGLLLRRLGPLWIESLYLALINDFAPLQEGSTVPDSSNLDREDHTTFEKVHEFCRRVKEELLLDDVWNMKPLINGQELMGLLGIPPGPAIRTYLEREIEWQLEHPEGSKEECAEWLKQQHQTS